MPLRSKILVLAASLSALLAGALLPVRALAVLVLVAAIVYVLGRIPQRVSVAGDDFGFVWRRGRRTRFWRPDDGEEPRG